MHSSRLALLAVLWAIGPPTAAARLKGTGGDRSHLITRRGVSGVRVPSAYESVKWLVVLLLVMSIAGACTTRDREEQAATDSGVVTATPAVRQTPSAKAPAATLTSPPSGPMEGSWDLWVGGTHVRGANIQQRRVYPELDCSEFTGPGPVGPPYRQGDFDRLASLGANYVNISHAGLFSEDPPCTLVQPIQDNLDNLLAMIAAADRFAVVSLRTGPGRA